MKIVRFYHSGVVADWRNRERHMIEAGVDVALLSARRWRELGTTVELTEPDPFVRGVRTVGSHPFGFVYAPRPVLRALRDAPDVIDVHEEPASLAAAQVLLARWLARRARVPLVFYSAQNIYKRYPPPFRWLERAFLRRARGAYVCNQEAGDVLRRKGFRGAIEVIPLGVDTSLFDPATASDPPSGLEIGYVGRLDDHKGVDVLLRAIALVPAARVRIVGDGVERASLESLAGELRIADRVEFLGARARTDLPAFFRSLSALAVPSQPTAQWKEQFGRVAAEAMSVGTPVIASDSGSLPEVVGPGGVIVPPGDVAALADAIRAVNEPARRASLSADALRWARQFRWEVVATSHVALYEKVLEQTA